MGKRGKLNRADPAAMAEYDARRRRIEKFVIVALIMALMALLGFEDFLFDYRGSFPFPYNLLFFTLINVHIILIFVLLFLIFRNIAKLVFERRAKVFGSKLRTKLVVAFAAFALIPTIAFFYVAVTFITYSIERWFSIQVEASLSESLEVAQNSYKAYEQFATFAAARIGDGLTDAMEKEDEFDFKFPNAILEDFLEEQQTEYKLDGLAVYVEPKQSPAFTAGRVEEEPLTDGRKLALLNKGWKGQSESGTFEFENSEMIWGISPLRNGNLVVGVLVVRFRIPENLLGRMRSIVSAYEDYKKVRLMERPLKISYVVILGLIAAFIFFSASWFGFLLSRNLAGPIQNLAQATQKVAKGDLDVRLEPTSGDELGALVENFNIMTQGLAQSRSALEQAAEDLRKSNVELDLRNAYMETVQGNINAGVIALDEFDRISTINPSARKILAMEDPEPLGKPVKLVLSGDVNEQLSFVVKALRRAPDRRLLRQVEVDIDGRSRMLLFSVAMISDEAGKKMGTVLVVEDLTDLVKAQRMAAWQEVARRIAHEIKNPLTPIQLAAQRLRKRYASKFKDDDTVFMDSTAIIIQQVEELKKLVNEFSNFARMAEPKPDYHDINLVLKEAVTLYREAHKNIRFHTEMDEALPELFCDRDQLKRVFINLLDNAVASIETKGGIVVNSQYHFDQGKAEIVVEDDGCGLPSAYKDRVFEPYFSTKKMGTGLGLAIVHQIVTDLDGTIALEDNLPSGTRVVITLPMRKGASKTRTNQA